MELATSVGNQVKQIKSVGNERVLAGNFARIFARTLVPLFLILLCPPFAGLLWFIHTKLDGSISALFALFGEKGFGNTIIQIWSPIFWGSSTAWTILGVFAGFQLLFMRFLPGRSWEGPVTPKGNIPVYKANGVLTFGMTLVLFCLCSFGLHLFEATILYDHLGELLGALNLFSLSFCLLLYLKGLYAPSSSDHGSSGNPLFDYYWGTELYPRIAGWDIKMFTNCRFGMMGWGLLLISYAAKQFALYGKISDSLWVSVGLQLVYIAKFFWWETGYLRSLDIMHDRAGFYICWGCLVWIPSVYTSASLYLVKHPNELGPFLAPAIFLIGVTAILVNYWSDAQRQLFRASGGKTKIWGKDPVYFEARYCLPDGSKKTNLLLASGWWGVARHFHYLPELTAALCWTIPALWDNFLPYFYFLFLTILLFNRATRDDKRCADKYREDWLKYCKQVPFKIIPGIY